MKYAIIKVSDGNFSVVEEGFTDLNTAKKRWHHHCEALYAASDFSVACVQIVDENLNSVGGDKYRETIDKRPAPEAA